MECSEKAKEKERIKERTLRKDEATMSDVDEDEKCRLTPLKYNRHKYQWRHSLLNEAEKTFGSWPSREELTLK